MQAERRTMQSIYLPFQTTSIIFFTLLLVVIIETIIRNIITNDFLILNRVNVKTKNTISTRSFATKMNNQVVSSTNSTFTNHNKTLDTKIRCVGPLYNQSCLYQNLYYIDGTFMILTVKGKRLPICAVRTNAFNFYDITPSQREFESYSDLEKFVLNIMDLKVIPSVTLYFVPPWHWNIGHALFDGLYPAYVALIRFPPRHLQPFRILIQIEDCKDCWSEDIYSRFAGLGILKRTVLNKLSNGKWFMFDELVMGSGNLCQRCVQPNLQLPGGVELDASRLFRDRMYQQHGLIPPTIRQKSSLEHRTSRDLLRAYVIHNKRFTLDDQDQIHNAINEINNYTNSFLNKTIDTTTKLKWPLIHVTYIDYNKVKGQNLSSIQIKSTPTDSRSPTHELVDNDFIAQLRILRQMDIHISGPGTGQMYQTFLSDGTVTINLGGIKPYGLEKSVKAFTSYLEQHMTSGTPYIKGLYYPINERPKGIKKDEVMKLIRQAGQLILQGFSLPVNPRENLAADGQLFVEMCEKDKEFCSSVTIRSAGRNYACIDFWPEEFLHEYYQWKLGGYIRNHRSVSCSFNRTLLHQLRDKYGIKHKGTFH